LTQEPTDTELLASILKPKSHFGRACGRLGIEVIPAGSPPAKGRVERNHGVGQGRLVNALRLEGVSAIADASRFPLEAHLTKINDKFSRPAQSADMPL
jgi:hypothetical protein